MKSWRYVTLPDYKMEELTMIESPEDEMIARIDGEEEVDSPDLEERFTWIFTSDDSPLTKKQKIVIWYRLFESKTFSQIGKMLGTSRQNAFEMYHKGIKSIKYYHLFGGDINGV